MGTTIVASASMVLELGALVIYNGVKHFPTYVWKGGMGWEGEEWAASLNLH